MNERKKGEVKSDKHCRKHCQISYVPSDIHIYRSKTGRKCLEKKEKTKGRSELKFFLKNYAITWYGMVLDHQKMPDTEFVSYPDMNNMYRVPVPLSSNNAE
jgi:hypothetical protein